MKQILRLFFFLIFVSIYSTEISGQSTSFSGKIIDQYDIPIRGAEIRKPGSNEVLATTDTAGAFSLQVAGIDSVKITKVGHEVKTIATDSSTVSWVLERDFAWSDLLNPMFYIRNGGFWLILFIVFAETGLMVGFFLPGDSLLFVAGIYSKSLMDTLIPGGTGNDFIDLLILIIMVSICGILGNMVGYWFGKKSGPFLFTRKDTVLFKRKHLLRAKEFYDKHGGQAIVFARFLPIVRTFAPVIAGIVLMDRKKFMYYNIVGCIAWVASMLVAGHYLDKFFIRNFGFDLKQHLEVIVLVIVVVTTLPVIYKLFFGKKPVIPEETPPNKV
jgi:membrane-associated protein